MDYVDANILAYAFSSDGLKSEKSRQLLKDHELVTCTLSLDEVAWKFFKISPSLAVSVVRGLQSAPKLSFLPFTRDEFDDFTRLLEHGTAPRDAVHAATALKLGCKTIYSEDKDFDKVKGLKRRVPW
ncbi:hypothetical protein AUJ14_00405 [Candidatus Micrarchaeota archaeon CG1_02_55_22]|nr:MAG: hypothetical protein AUJ14_00405 [Candidatus Micrarchaeota archaeon CG1_02_55_22]